MQKVPYLRISLDWQASVCSLQVRLQRPTISAEMSFLLAVMKFYVPDFAIASVTPIPFQTQDVLLTGEHPPI